MTKENLNQNPSDSWKEVVDEAQIERALTRIAYEILEKDDDAGSLAIVGIRTGGEFLGKRINEILSKLSKVDVPFGVIDITLYRDDLSHATGQPTLKGTDLPFSIAGKRIILVDDVLYTGRTIRAALDAVIDFGRPSRVELAVLADRGHREFPIRPDYVGKNIPTHMDQFVRVKLKETVGVDGVYLITKGADGKGEEG